MLKKKTSKQVLITSLLFCFPMHYCPKGLFVNTDKCFHLAKTTIFFSTQTDLLLLGGDFSSNEEI